MARPDNEKWLTEALVHHARLSTIAASLIESLIKKRKIEYLSVVPRTKSMRSAIEKIERKQYRDPHNQLTDLSGVRVITFLEEHVKQISDLIRKTFSVDEENSLDRVAILGQDKIGYRSTHFVCQLGKSREKLPEYDLLADLKFEIQVRTVLQHAWAELAHDRSFKLGTGLPENIQRKLNLYSGMLEVIDGAFDEIAKEIDKYILTIDQQTPDQTAAEKINAISLTKFLSGVEKKYKFRLREHTITGDYINEIERYGISTIGEMEKLPIREVILAEKKSNVEATNIGLVRSLMMYADIHKYFATWKKEWTAIDEKDVRVLAGKYSRKELERLFEDNGVKVYPDEDEPSEDSS